MEGSHDHQDVPKAPPAPPAVSPGRVSGAHVSGTSDSVDASRLRAVDTRVTLPDGTVYLLHKSGAKEVIKQGSGAQTAPPKPATPTHDYVPVPFSKPASEVAKVGSQRKQFTMVTWNIFFGNLHSEERWTHVLEETLACNPDIIAFQECTQHFQKLLRQEKRIMDHYQWAPENGFASSFNCWYGVMLLVRNDIQIQHAYVTMFESRMGRVLLTVAVELGGAVIGFSTAHFESLNHELDRKRQLQVASTWAADKKLHNHVIVGDFNMGDGKENASIPAGYTDCWPVVHPENPTAVTWDWKNNPTIKASNPSDRAMSRLDRVIVRGGLKCVSMELLGTKPTVMGNTLCPSDHYGVTAKIEVLETAAHTKGEHGNDKGHSSSNNNNNNDNDNNSSNVDNGKK